MESVVNHDEETLGRAQIGDNLENGNYCTVSLETVIKIV